MNDPTYYVDELGGRGVPIYDVWPKGAQFWVYHPKGPVTPHEWPFHTPPEQECPAAGMYLRSVGARLWLPLYPEESMPLVCKGLPTYPEPTADFEQAMQDWVSTHFSVPLGWRLDRAWVAAKSGWRSICCAIMPLAVEV